jgi:hypothetical protein
MRKIQILFHDAGGGHRNAAVALETIVAQQHRPWQVELVQFQELTDQLDVLRKLTGIRIQEQYNTLLRNGWTLGSEQLLRVLQATIRLFDRPMVKLLITHFQQHPADLLVSVIPHFNRQIAEAWTACYPGRPFVTIITDLADYPPHFWIEPIPEQYVICGTEKAFEQAREIGKDRSHVFVTSGMILRPDFYVEENIDAVVLRTELRLQPDLPTGMLLFGGFGSKAMYDIAEQLEAAELRLQLIVICGRNEKLAEKFRSRAWKMPIHVVGFTKEVHRLMRAADFLVGKPGPGSVAEAMVRKLPVILECNSWTLPQERYNTEWVKEKNVGVILRDFGQIAGAVKELLRPGKLSELRCNTEKLNNQAIFEIPEIFAELLHARAAGS